MAQRVTAGKRGHALVLAAILVFAGTLTSPAQAAAYCEGPFDISDQQQIPRGMGVLQRARLGANCVLVVEAPQFVSATLVAVLARGTGAGPGTIVDRLKAQSQRASSSRIPGNARPRALVPGGPIYEFLRIKDGYGLVVTAIDTHNYSYSYDGNFITGYNHSATTQRASDSTGRCGSSGYFGWTVFTSSDVVYDGV